VVFLDEAREAENESEVKVIETTVADKLDYLSRDLSRLYDVLLQKEIGNQEARADLVVNGEVLIPDAPATFLLGMETRLKALRQVLLHIPTLEPGRTWTEDEASGILRLRRGSDQTHAEGPASQGPLRRDQGTSGADREVGRRCPCRHHQNHPEDRPHFRP
jgi:hypothetical protein